MVQEKFKKIVLILPILALLVLFCTVMVSYRSGASVSDYKRVYTLYQVQYGDTAYGLASENKYPGMDSRDYIMELNEVNSGIDLFEDPLYYGSYLLIVKYAEWKYLLDCLNGNRIYSLNEKLKMNDENSIGGLV